MDHSFCMHVLCLCMKFMHKKGWSVIQTLKVPTLLKKNMFLKTLLILRNKIYLPKHRIAYLCKILLKQCQTFKIRLDPVRLKIKWKTICQLLQLNLRSCMNHTLPISTLSSRLPLIVARWILKKKTRITRMIFLSNYKSRIWVKWMYLATIMWLKQGT